MNAGQHNDLTLAVVPAAGQVVSGRRRKIEIKRIEVPSSLFVAFSKRRNGLFGKLDKFCKMSPPGTEAVVITFSPAANKTHARGYPSVEPVLSRFLEHMAGAAAKRPGKRSRLSMVAVEERRDEEVAGGGSGGEESMELEELKESEAALLGVKRDVEMRMSEDQIRECRTKIFF